MNAFTPPMMVPWQRVESQIRAFFRAWDFDEAQGEACARVMVDADLNGIDSHGIATLLYYDRLIRDRMINPRPVLRIEREGRATALIDADGGLGHRAGLVAIDLACAKARETGVAAVAVHHSDHFGAAGFYVARAARAGMISIVTSNGHTRCVVPAGGARPMFSTNPIAFGAPADGDWPLTVDIATSTASIGKVNLAWLAGETIPEGWVVDDAGRPVTDPGTARTIIYETGEGGLTPLGGTAAMSVHKGYGLCLLVEVLSALVGGAAAAPLQGESPDRASDDESIGPRTNTGHFFLAIDPRFFRPDGGFQRELTRFMDALRATPAADPHRPVLVPGDLELRHRIRRQEAGIPMPASLVGQLRAIAERDRVAWDL